MKQESHEKMLVYSVLVIMGMIFLFGSNTIIGLTGNAVREGYVLKEMVYEVNKPYSSSGVYVWSPGKNTTVNDLKVEGEIFGTGNVEVSLIRGGTKVILLKRTTNNEKVNVEEYVELPEGTDIGLTLEYSDGDWDYDNDGVASSTDGVDVEIKPLFFSDIERKHLCTLWEVYSLEREDYESLCYGSSKCCGFLGPSASSDDWNEDFVLVKGNHGSTTNNIILSRIVFYNGSKYSYSNYDGISARFVNQQIINNLNESPEDFYESKNYLFRVNVGQDTIFNFDKIRYIVEVPEEKEENLIEVITKDRENETIPEIQETETGYKIYKSNVSNYVELELDKTYVSNLRILANEEDVDINVDFINITDSFQKIEIKPNSELDAIVSLKIPLTNIEERELILINDGKLLDPVYLRSDADYVYFRTKMKLSDLTISLVDRELEELSGVKSSSKWMIYIYFISSLVVALCIYLFAGAGKEIKNWFGMSYGTFKFDKDLKKIKKITKKLNKRI